jgi:hypothetical protein
MSMNIEDARWLLGLDEKEMEKWMAVTVTARRGKGAELGLAIVEARTEVAGEVEEARLIVAAADHVAMLQATGLSAEDPKSWVATIGRKPSGAALIRAIKAKNADAVRWALAGGACVHKNYTNEPLALAVEKDWIEGVDMLLAGGAQLDREAGMMRFKGCSCGCQKPVRVWNEIMWWSGSSEMARALIERGAPYKLRAVWQEFGDEMAAGVVGGMEQKRIDELFIGHVEDQHRIDAYFIFLASHSSPFARAEGLVLVERLARFADDAEQVAIFSGLGRARHAAPNRGPSRYKRPHPSRSPSPSAGHVSRRIDRHKVRSLNRPQSAAFLMPVISKNERIDTLSSLAELRKSHTVKHNMITIDNDKGAQYDRIIPPHRAPARGCRASRKRPPNRRNCRPDGRHVRTRSGNLGPAGDRTAPRTEPVATSHVAEQAVDRGSQRGTTFSCRRTPGADRRMARRRSDAHKRRNLKALWLEHPDDLG